MPRKNKGEKALIKIIEKAGRFDDSLFTGDCMMYPIFMIKDGEEYFVFNRRQPEDGWREKERQAQISELLASSGSYFRFNGFYANPLDMLKEMSERGHTFCDPDQLFDDCRNNPEYGKGFVDFCGNRNEVSASFHYRIYDMALLEKIKEAVAYIINRTDA